MARSLPLPARRPSLGVAVLTMSTTVWLSACGAPPEELDEDPSASRTEPDVPDDVAQADPTVAPFDLEAGEVPLPSDLFLDDGALDLGDIDARSDAEAELFERLSGRDGYPRQTSLFFPTRAPVDAGSLPGRVLLLETDGAAELPLGTYDVTGDVTGNGIRAIPIGPLAPGRTYVFAVLHGVRLASGEPLQPAADLSAALAVDATPDSDDAARVRTVYLPGLHALETRGISRSSVVSLGVFTTSSAPTSSWDARTGTFPVPSDALIDDTGRVAVAPTEIGPEVTLDFSGYDGFSTTADIPVRADAPLDLDSALAWGAVRLFALDAAGAASADLAPDVTPVALGAGAVTGGDDVVALRPERALETQTRYALVVRDTITADGRPLSADLHTLARTLEAPLVEDAGRSTLRLLADDEAAFLEPHRAAAAPLLASLPLDVPPRAVAGLQLFTTLDARAQVRALREALYDDDTPTAIDDVLVQSPWDRGLWLLMPGVQTVISGTFVTRDRIDPVSRRAHASATTPTPIEFLVTVPGGAEPGDPLPVVLFGHGLGTSRELVYIVANWLADAGFASFAIDLPYHGARSICLVDEDCEGAASCTDVGRCELASGEEAALTSTVDSPWENGPEVPNTTGQVFIELDNLFASRDHIHQALVDLSQAVRVIRDPAFSAAAEGWMLDGDDISYFGISLGGLVGGALAGVEDHIGSFALNVPGAGLVDTIEASTILGEELSAYVDALDLAPDSAGYARFKNAAKWAIDPADPVNLVPDDGSKRFLIQMADGDTVMPNPATWRLAMAAGVEPEVFTPAVVGHGFIGNPVSFEAARAREQIVDFLAER